jgi:uncharacterized cupredoxin-like copper-binding protein
MTRFRFGLLALSALLAVGTWVTLTTPPASAQASTRMAVTLSEFSIMSEVPEVPAGEVVFDVVNTGEDVHEMIVIKSDLDIKALPPSPSAKNEVDESAIGEYIGGFEDVQSGTAASGALVLGPGRYILLCNLSKHYENGMVTTLQVN